MSRLALRMVGAHLSRCTGGLLPVWLAGAIQTGYLNSYVNNPQAVMNNEGGFLRWVMCGR